MGDFGDGKYEDLNNYVPKFYIKPLVTSEYYNVASSLSPENYKDRVTYLEWYIPPCPHSMHGDLVNELVNVRGWQLQDFDILKDRAKSLYTSGTEAEVNSELRPKLFEDFKSKSDTEAFESLGHERRSSNKILKYEGNFQGIFFRRRTVSSTKMVPKFEEAPTTKSRYHQSTAKKVIFSEYETKRVIKENVNLVIQSVSHILSEKVKEEHFLTCHINKLRNESSTNNVGDYIESDEYGHHVPSAHNNNNKNRSGVFQKESSKTVKNNFNADTDSITLSKQSIYSDENTPLASTAIQNHANNYLIQHQEQNTKNAQNQSSQIKSKQMLLTYLTANLMKHNPIRSTVTKEQNLHKQDKYFQSREEYQLNESGAIYRKQQLGGENPNKCAESGRSKSNSCFVERGLNQSTFHENISKKDLYREKDLVNSSSQNQQNTLSSKNCVQEIMEILTKSKVEMVSTNKSKRDPPNIKEMQSLHSQGTAVDTITNNTPKDKINKLQRLFFDCINHIPNRASVHYLREDKHPIDCSTDSSTPFNIATDSVSKTTESHKYKSLDHPFQPAFSSMVKINEKIYRLTSRKTSILNNETKMLPTLQKLYPTYSKKLSESIYTKLKSINFNSQIIQSNKPVNINLLSEDKNLNIENWALNSQLLSEIQQNGKRVNANLDIEIKVAEKKHDQTSQHARQLSLVTLNKHRDLYKKSDTHIPNKMQKSLLKNTNQVLSKEIVDVLPQNFEQPRQILKSFKPNQSIEEFTQNIKSGIPNSIHPLKTLTKYQNKTYSVRDMVQRRSKFHCPDCKTHNTSLKISNIQKSLESLWHEQKIKKSCRKMQEMQVK